MEEWDREPKASKATNDPQLTVIWEMGTWKELNTANNLKVKTEILP